ncbi:hypothetical protein Tco_0439741 [Tanacetum coccineum]
MDDKYITMSDYINGIEDEKEKARKRGKVLTGKLLSMVRSGMMKTFTTSDPLKPNSQLQPLMTSISFDDSDDEDYTSEEDNDDSEIDKIQSSMGNEITQGSNILSESSHDKITKTFRTGSFVMNLKVNIVIWTYYANGMLFYLIMNLYVPFGIPFDPKRYYKDGDYARMLRRPRAIRHMALPPRDQRHQVQVFDFVGLPDLMAEGLSAMMLMEHRDAQGQSVRCMSWREFILALGLYTAEEMLTVGFGAYWAESARQIPDKGDLRDYWIGISSAGDFLDTTLSYTTIRDPILRLCHRLIYCSIAGRSQAPEKGLTVIALELPIIDMAELVRLQIYMEVDDTWDWVALGPERQPDAMVPQQPPPPPPPAATRTLPQRIARLEEDVHEIHGALAEQREVIGAMARDFSRFTVWAADGIAQLLDSTRVTYTLYFETRIPYQGRVKQRTGKASTSTAQQDQQQPDP